MRVKAVCLGVLIAGLWIAAWSRAQEGHPLTGTWYGEWGPAGEPNQVTIVLFWNGSEVSGIMDPGPYSAKVEATLDSTTWTVHLEAVGQDASGGTVTHIADGTMEDVGSRTRAIAGTWRTGDASYEFRITREE